MSPNIVAPFDGFVTAVNVKGGDYIYKGTVAVQIADPNQFESNIMVGEMNILKVKIGGTAQVQMNALPGLTFSGNVTFISPTATIQSGVVNYEVTVGVNPIPITGQAATSNLTGGRAGAAPQAVQLKDGLTDTVNIIVQQKNDVLLVPNSAIFYQGGKPYVEVMLPNGATNQQAIQTGITDFRNTEVISGLNEGDKVVIPLVSATTTTTTPRPGVIPGLGRGG
jgi:multidrug efflux pump subunit AcrA (membrane-fusion protein)